VQALFWVYCYASLARGRVSTHPGTNHSRVHVALPCTCLLYVLYDGPALSSGLPGPGHAACLWLNHWHYTQPNKVRPLAVEGYHGQGPRGRAWGVRRVRLDMGAESTLRRQQRLREGGKLHDDRDGQLEEKLADNLRARRAR
jgi:hypothetical protein